MTTLELVEGLYQEKVDRDSDRIHSQQIDLTAAQILQA